MINLAYIGLKWNYSKKEQGESHEFYNFEYTLRQGLPQINKLYVHNPDDNPRWDELRELVSTKQIDIILQVSFNSEYDLPEDIALAAIRNGIQVLEFCPDVSWRFKDWILPRRHRVSKFLTTHKQTVDWFRQVNVPCILTQWGVSSYYYRVQDRRYSYDCSMIGQKHSNRGDIINKLYAAGIDIELFGHYWDGFKTNRGYVSFADVPAIFNLTKVNINLSGAFFVNTPSQVKSRPFECIGCGGFLISTPADGLTDYFVPDKEIVVVNTMAEMIEKIKYYLANDSEREAIAEAGYKRAMTDHTWSKRFDAILAELR